MNSRKSTIVFTTFKAASVFLDKVIRQAAKLTETEHHYSKVNGFPVENILLKDHSAFDGKEGYFGPFRRFIDLNKLFEKYNVVLHLRDPRDVLTSLYFSHAFSHRRGGSEGFNPGPKILAELDKGLDDYVIFRTPEYLSYYLIYCDKLLGRDETIILRYEDMVGDFRPWLVKYLSPFGIDERSYEFKKIYNKNVKDFKVKEENVYEHKRQVTPGDHKRKLKAETIEYLNNQFAPVLERLGLD